MKSKTAIIIGSGVAGLASAIRLAVQGHSVSVYEKNNYPGGKLSAFVKDGFHFDAGPSLFTQPQNIAELFELAGEPIENYITYHPVDIACKYFYENGKVINAFTSPALFDKELQEKLNEAPNTLLNYLSNSKKAYNNIGNIFLNYSLHKSKTWFHKRVLKALASTKLSYLFKSLHKFNAAKFSSSEAIQIFNRFATYNGSNPYKAPSMLSLIPHIEYNEGVFYPHGGMISITNALYQLALKKGVQFYFNKPVQKIINNQGSINGVVVNSKNIAADIVISNIDIYFTYKFLLRDEFKAQKILKQQRSSSAVVFYWGINKIFEELELHNIFFSSNYQAEFDCLFNKKTFYKDPTVYINITAAVENNHAPAHCQNWFVMINVPANTGQDWEVIKVAAKKTIIEKLDRLLQTDIASLIVTEEILDPIIMETTTASYQGSLYGTSSNTKLAAFLRHPNFFTGIQNLYCCGGSVHPGGGIPLCFKSAKIICELIETKNKISS